MLYKKEGLPEESEIVICTVNNIHHHSVFIKIDEYGITGILHISEVSPGRIRNLRDYVQEGKKIICKVLRVNTERGHVDLSLRRVNDSQRRKKLEEIKLEQKSEKIVELVAKKAKLDFQKLYFELKEKIFEEYDGLYDCFEEVALHGLSLEKFGIAKKIADDLEELIKQRIKPPEVQIGGILSLVTYASDGIDIVKDILINNTKDVDVGYLGAGKYKLKVKAPDYKQAEKILNTSVESILKCIKDLDGEGEFVRQEIK
ncbi:translation initiation factor IF-2 subunit alpha [Candidatus Woesearchaeota archaeon CG11_big_fil_rev_8_21_14_0_20_43_8]|nr:MAG: translation initiation factor IF-2 subunit alpha [Candidatus Woesearchaeota archaeon CG11_big_fil_rev_8_21_14_0_20_43_8]PIO07994.1 MAG: translation initiation factor IF-2 subunit alpha [Candidatus Woesearchaeota archaeon CG08_land_8_20_14_0_20_43_7]